MEIYINKTAEETTKYSLLSAYPIKPLAQANNLNAGDVMALIEDNNFDALLKTALSHNVPVIAVATKDSVCYQQAQQQIHPHALVYYDNGRICSQNNVFAEAPGLSVKTLVSICEYAANNKLYPDIMVWKPQEDIISFAPKAEPKPEQKPVDMPLKPSPIQPATAKPQQSKAYIPAQTELQSFINSSERIIAVLRASPLADSSNIAAKLAKQLQTVHLSISSNPGQRQNPFFAYSDGNTVHYNSANMPGRYLVVEVDTQLQEALELTYKKAYKVVHVVNTPVECLEPLQVWTDSGFKLDAVIPIDVKDIPSFSDKYPACTVEEFVKLL